MDDFELRRIIYDYIKEICHYSQMQVFSTSSYQRNYFQLQIDDTINGLINFLLERDEIAIQQSSLASQVEWMQRKDQEIQRRWENPESVLGISQDEAEALQMDTEEPQEELEALQVEPEKPRIISLTELTEADGSGGRNAYVAVNGNVYDVSVASRWGGGTHFGLYAGHDLTSEFMACHNSMFEILKILPIIGVLQK